METGTETRDNKLFMIIALVLTGSLFLGLVGIGGLVLYRLVAPPTEVAMPPQVATPTVKPSAPATLTPSSLPSATPTAAPTATLVVPPGDGEPPDSGSNGAEGQDAPGLSSPSSDSSGMPQTGLGLMETIGLGLALVSLLGGTRAVRHLRAKR
jgi:hypothetical protein